MRMKKLTLSAALFLTATSATCIAADSQGITWERTWLDKIQLRWQPPVDDPHGMKPADMDDWRPAFSFNVSANCTVSDGKYIYSGATSFDKYDMEGNFIENFSIPDLPEMYCMTYDGKYFYGTSYEQFGIFQIDMDKRELVRIIPTKTQMYHLAYIPTLDGGKGGFEVGNPTQGTFLRMDGTPLGGLLDYAADLGSGWYCYGSTYMNGHLYIYCGDQSYLRKVMEYDVDKMEFTGNFFDLSGFIGQGGVQDRYAARNIATYTYPENRQYLMLIDYNGLTYYATSVLVGENPLVEGLQGYNIYRNGERINDTPIGVEEYAFEDSGLAETTPYEYEIKGVAGEMDGQDIFQTLVELPSTSQIPLTDDFSSYEMSIDKAGTKMMANYWTITPELPSAKWTVTGANGQCMQFSYAPDTKYRQTLVSKPLQATAGHSVRLSMSYACNYYGQGTENERMTVQVTTDGGVTWTEAGSVSYKPSTAFTPVEFDLTDLVAGKRFQFRLKGDGESVSFVYNWQIDDIKVWEYRPTNAEMTITFAGTQVTSPLNVTLTMEDIGETYTCTTDNTGHFAIADIESGTYDVTVSSGNFTQTVEGLSIGSDQTEYTIDLPGGYFESETSSIELTVAPGASQTVSIPFTNAGNAEAPSSVSLGFENLGEGELHGNSTLEVSPEYSLTSAFDLASANEASLFIYGSRLWTKVNDYSVTKLNSYTPDGQFVETVTLTADGELPNTISGFFATEDSVYVYTMAALWKDPAVPVYIIPIDWSRKQILTDRKRAIDAQITAVSAIHFEKSVNTLYVRDASNGLYEVSPADGTVIKKHTLPDINYSGLAFDSFGKGGPYLWMLEKASGEAGFSLVRYSLEEEQFTLDRYSLNNDPESILNGISAMAMYDGSIIGTTQLKSGYYSLAIRQNLSGTPAAGTQILAYRIFPVETWLQAGESEEVAAGQQASLPVTVNATDLADKSIKTGSVIISSDNLGKDLVIPVTLHVDSDIAAQYPAPVQIKAAVNDNYEVELSWTQPDSRNKVKTYYAVRDGETLENGTSDTHLTDYLPKEGEQAYRIVAVYESGYRTMSQEEVKVTVSDPVWGLPVTNMKASVVARDNVRLSWDKTPQYRSAFFDDFESYDPFLTEGIGEWTLVDGDRMWTFGNNNIDYPNETAQMAGMTYNPSRTTPATSPLGNGSEQCFTFISGNIAQMPNDDWLISPLLALKGSSTFRFEACTASTSYGKERIYACYSTTGNAPADFIALTDNVIEVEGQWTTFEFEVPANTRYVAIHYVSQNTFMLFVDNIFVGQTSGYSPAAGYNVYRDGKKLNDMPLAENRYTDYSLPDGDYEYKVEILFENGASAMTDPHSVTVDTRERASAPRDLTLVEQAEGSVRLSWRTPEVAESLQLRYDNGEVANSLGGNSHVYVAVKWDETDIRLYEGYSITGLHFHIAEPVSSVTPLLFRDGVVVRTGEPFEPTVGTFTDYTFTEPLLLEGGHSYMVGYYAAVDPGYYPLSHDAGPGTPGKSDLISTDGVEWNSIFELYGTAEYDINWSIAANLEIVPVTEATAGSETSYSLPTDKTAGKQLQLTHKFSTARPEAYNASETVDRLLGYNVYRNEECLNSTPQAELTYTDTPLDDAVYYVTAVWSESGELASDKVEYHHSGLDKADISTAVYPNPVSDRLYIEGLFDRILIHTASGQLVYEAGNESRETAVSVPVSGFARGVYVITILHGNETSHHKVIVN